MKQDSRKKLLAAAMLAIGMCGVIAHWLWYPSTLSTYATLLLVVISLLVMKQAAKWQLFQLSPTFPIPIPQVKARWNLRFIGKGVLCFLAAFAWAGIFGLGIRWRLIDDVSITVAWLLLSPSFALIATGIFLMARGIFARNS